MGPLRFERINISDERYESCGVFDVNNNGSLDIVSGAYWYPGPDFDRKCPIGPIRAEGEYFDDFSTIPMDINGNGYLDFVTGGRWGDIDGDGECELVTGKRYRAHCGHDPGAYDPYGLYYFKWTGEGFSKLPIEFGEARHTKGCGISFQVADLWGRGRPDIICPGKDGLTVYKNLPPARNMD